MPSVSPQLKQFLVSGSGVLANYTNVGSNIQIPGGINNPQGTGVLVVYDAPPADHQWFGRFAEARSNKPLSYDNLGIEGSVIDTHYNTRNVLGDLDVAPVDHLKYRGILSTIEPWDTYAGYPYVAQIATPRGVWRPGLPKGVAMSSVAQPPSATLRPLCDEAFNRFHTMFPEELSIANFIYELREISSLIPTLSKSLRKMIAGGFLNLEFGWKPLLGDLRTMLHALDRVDARLQYLKSRYRKPTRGGYSTLVEYMPSGIPAMTQVGPLDGLVLRYTITSYECKFTAGARIMHEISELDSLSTQVRALLFSFGFGNVAQIAWNVIPYSFVLGWFTNIEGLIGRYGNLQQLASDWHVDRMTWSTKIKSNVDVDQVWINPAGTVLRTARRGSYTVERYRRFVGLSVSDSILALSDPSTKQTALLAALVAGRNY